MRKRLLEATFEVLSRAGPRKLSMSAVAAAAGVSRVTLYRWFPSKEALLEAFGVYEQQKYDAGMAEAVAGLVATHASRPSCASSSISSTPTRCGASSRLSPSTSSTR